MTYEELKIILEDNQAREKNIELQNIRKQKEYELYKNSYESYYDNKYSNINESDEYNKFKDKVSKAFITEALTGLLEECIGGTVQSDYTKNLSRQLVSNFVNEEGSRNLLNKMKRTSYLMSELAYVCENTINAVLEKANKKDNDTLKITSYEKDNFYKDLSKVNADKAINTIKDRVMDSTREFVDTNTKDKMKIQDALEKTKEKVDKVKEKSRTSDEAKDSIQEQYINDCNRRITDIKSSKTKNVFECMVYSLSRTSLTNDEAKSVFVENATINMDKILEHCEVMYTFLTMLDSCKLINVDEAYIENVLKDLSN